VTETRDSSIAATDAEKGPGARRLPGSQHRSVLAGIVAGVAIVFALGFAFDAVTASPAFCGSCHEMGERTESWGESAHVSVKCVECHQPPTEWYQVGQRMADRGRLIARDFGAHFSGEYESPVDTRSPGVAPVGDEVCTHCHDVNRKATSGYRILIDHPEHAKRNGSCISCHVRTAHPIAELGTPLTLMAQCFTCHGLSAGAKAPGACETCHPGGYSLTPPSHEEPEWRKGGHGDVARDAERAGGEKCDMCHAKKQCDDCHGLPMPHPTEWARGERGHAAAAKTNRAVCTNCHGSSPDMCTMCHHSGYEPAKGTWAKQHFIQVRTGGASRCFECHSPLFCVDCHSRD
jgi:cytochrome c nitrite reductase small subunit